MAVKPADSRPVRHDQLAADVQRWTFSLPFPAHPLPAPPLAGCSANLQALATLLDKEMQAVRLQSTTI